MRQSLSHPAGSFSAPNHEEQPAILSVERDLIWEQLTQEQYDAYYRMVWNIAYLIVGHPLEADIVADKVMAIFGAHVYIPENVGLEAHLRVLARSRALDCLDSPLHRFRMRCRSLVQQDDDEEYEIVPSTYSSIGAEEEFFYEEERELFAQQFVQAISRLNDLQRACFVLRFVEHIKPEEIAEMLKVPVDIVYTQAYRARNRVAKLLNDGRKQIKSAKKAKGGFPSGRVVSS